MTKFKVNIDMNFSQDIYVSAKTKTEAKEKAWEKFVNKKTTKKNFQIYVDKVPD